MPKPYKTKVEDYVDVFGLKLPRASIAADDDVCDAVWGRIITKYPRYNPSIKDHIYKLVMDDFYHKYTVKTTVVEKIDSSSSAIVGGIDVITTKDQQGNYEAKILFQPLAFDILSPMEAASIVSKKFYEVFTKIKEKK